uniref:PGG domain-containing protein n=1 Tax=Globodera pallida TaxID=36090 RepID=A0A183CGV8_GLOPA
MNAKKTESKRDGNCWTRPQLSSMELNRDVLANIRQKIAEDSFLDEKNKEKMAKLLGHFEIGMDKFYALIKDRLNVAHSQDEAGHSNGGNALRQHQRRRRKRMRTLGAVTGRLSSAFSTENAGQTQPASLYEVLVCVGMFVTIACTIGAAIFLATSEISHPPLKIAMFAFLVVAFLIQSPLFIWQCVVNKL